MRWQYVQLTIKFHRPAGCAKSITFQPVLILSKRPALQFAGRSFSVTLKLLPREWCLYLCISLLTVKRHAKVMDRVCLAGRQIQAHFLGVQVG